MPEYPRATILVPLHNHENYIEDHLESLFAQWTPNLDLLLIDDCSKDNGFAIAKRTLARHTSISATTLRNERSLGAGLLPTALRLAKTDIIIESDSDDLSLPGRLHEIVARFAQDPTCRLVTSNAVLISADGFVERLWDPVSPDAVLTDPLAAAATVGDARWLGSTIAFHTDVFHAFPPLDPETSPYGLDFLMPFRALLLGSHHYIARPLVGWRQHSHNTHRLYGAKSMRIHGMERHGAMETMILRQRISDAEYVRDTREPEYDLEEVVDQCRRQFFTHFDLWSRLKTATLQDRSIVPADVDASERLVYPPSPPVVTLLPGQRLDFSTEFGKSILASWSGFNDLEIDGAWTKRHALLCLRITDPAVNFVRVFFSGLYSVNHQRVSLSLGLHDWTHVDLGGPEDCDLLLPVHQTGEAWLFISALDAATPPNGDPRTLGVYLRWIEAVVDVPDAAAQAELPSPMVDVPC